MAKRHFDKILTVLIFMIISILISFSTYNHIKEGNKFVLLSTDSIKFLIPFAIALCSLGFKFKNYFLVKFPIVILTFMSLFLAAGKFSFIFADKYITFIIQCTLYFLLLIFSLIILLEWEIHVDIKSSKEFEEKKIKLYFIIKKIRNNSYELDDLCLLNDINSFFKEKVARIILYKKFRFLFSEKFLKKTKNK